MKPNGKLLREYLNMGTKFRVESCIYDLVGDRISLEKSLRPKSLSHEIHLMVEGYCTIVFADLDQVNQLAEWLKVEAHRIVGES